MSLFASGIRPIVDAYLLEESKKVRSYGEYWSASSAGYCMRKVMFERMGVPKNNDDPRRQRVFTSGHIFHNWIQELTKKAGISIAQEVELQDEELMVRGHFDDLVLVQAEVITRFERGKPDEHEVGPHLILYDYKTVNSRSFMWAKKNGNAMSHFHRLQLGTYMYMLRNKKDGALWDDPIEGKKIVWGLTKDLKEARILKIEKDALMMGEQQLMWSEELERDVVQYWTTLNDYWKKQILPPCTCDKYEGGFMSKEQYNGYFYNGESCSIDYYKRWKAENGDVPISYTV